MSSLINSNHIKKGDDRETIMSESEATGKLKADEAQKQRERHKRLQGEWKPIKSDIDEMTPDELLEYVKGSVFDRDDPRTGFMTVKINSHEYAVIKLAMHQTKARSLRKLLIDIAFEKAMIYKPDSESEPE